MHCFSVSVFPLILRRVLSSRVLFVWLMEQIEVVDELEYLIKWSALSYQFCTWETREEVSLACTVRVPCVNPPAPLACDVPQHHSGAVDSIRYLARDRVETDATNPRPIPVVAPQPFALVFVRPRPCAFCRTFVW